MVRIDLGTATVHLQLPFLLYEEHHQSSPTVEGIQDSCRRGPCRSGERERGGGDAEEPKVGRVLQSRGLGMDVLAYIPLSFGIY